MKRIPFLLACLLALLLTALPQGARAEEVNFDFFYSSLADDGDWYNTPEYGYVFQPDIAFKNDKWRPYSDGYWAQTEDGWTWVSYENFGWAAYHYGRWTRLADTGWVWVPGYEWGPGWVSWRANDDYVGWAPLPPKRERVVYEGRVVEPPPRRAPEASFSLGYSDVEEDYDRGYGPAVDEDYDIGPDNYSFVECRQFGAPVIREVILPPQQNFVFVENTVNVTNIVYRRDGDRRVVYCGGPNYDFVSRRSERPIQQLRLERREDLGFVREGVRRGGNATQVRDGVLQVAAPLVARRDTDFRQMRPQRVKADLQQARAVRGWDNAKADPQQVQRLREKIKTQAAAPPRTQNAALAPGERPPDIKVGERPPGFERRPGDARPGSIPPQPAAPAAASPAGPRQPLTDAERTARRDQRQREREERERARTSGQPVPPAGQPGAELTDQERAARREKRDQNRAARGQEQPVPAPQPQPDQPRPGAPQDRDARRTARQQGQPTPAPQPQAGQPDQPRPGAELTDQDRAARREKRDQNRAARGQEQPAPTPKPQADAQGQQDRAGRRAAIQQQQEQQQQQVREARRASRQQERAPQPPPQPQADAGQQDRAARRAARQQEQAQQQQEQGQQQARAARQQQEQTRQAQQRAELQRNAREAVQQQRMRQPQPQPQPEAKPQPQPQKQDDDDKKKKKRDNQ